MKRRGGPIAARVQASAGLACGASVFAAIAGTGFVARLSLGPGFPLPLATPMGATAVLIFAAPGSPLARPWPVVGGSVVSTLVGVAVASLFPASFLTAGLAVGAAIVVMSLLRCLHPPGGAAALMAVMGDRRIAELGWTLAVSPIGLNALLMVMAGSLIRSAGRAWARMTRGEWSGDC